MTVSFATFDRLKSKGVAAYQNGDYLASKTYLVDVAGCMLDMAAAGPLRFFHFELNADRPACAAKRFGGCGAGTGYACVAPDGSVYPCHQFDGEREFEMLRLDGSTAGGGPQFAGDGRFAAAHAGAKAACRGCWAQLHCGGGCHYTAWRHGGGLLDPAPLSCDLLRLRLEHALALAALRAPGPVPDRILSGPAPPDRTRD